jgi:tagatose-6-phosphate ketose/aldose isomerase
MRCARAGTSEWLRLRAGEVKVNPLQRLVALDDEGKKRLGVEATPAEIAQQPEMWRDTAGRLREAAPGIRELLRGVALPGGVAEVVFCGAGTSDFVGRCVQGPVTAALGTRGIAVPTTDVVTHPECAFPANRPGVMVSFARSGNSPESVAAMEIALIERPEMRHLVITCNEEGELARKARALGERAYCLVLHPKTNDRGLAMTSSFSSMVVAGLGLGYLDKIEEYVALVKRLARAGERVLEVAPEIAEGLAKRRPLRACFLGSGAAYGAAVESHLKLQELTDGGIICLCDTFLGIRHGPRAAIHEDTLVVSFVASDPQVRRYEVDLLRANREQGVGLAHVIVADRKEGLEELADEVIEFDPEGRLALPDGMLSPVYTIVGQLLGLFASLEHGLKPDAPSAGGVIHRVVQGVTIHPRERPPR